MEVTVRFRYNKLTGEVEIFDVDDVASNLSVEEHNREHDRITVEIGSAIVRNPRIQEVPADLTPAAAKQTATPDSAEAAPVVDRNKQR
jgi:hypothetical protein